MTRFDRNDRVIFEHNGVRVRGKVTRVEPQKRRVVADSGERLLLPVRRLKPSPDRALILETRLDRSLRSRRVYGPMMQQWLRGLKIEALYERVHTVEAVKRFIQDEGKNPATRFIHIMGHGTNDAGIGTATLHLTFEKLHLGERTDVFENLSGKVIILSCCEVGADLRVMQNLKAASGAAAVIGYRVAVDDWYTNVAEGLLYERLINSTCTPQRAVSLIMEAMAILGTKTGDAITRKPVMVCV